MPINLPVQPNGPTQRPADPQDPPNLVDIRNSVVYSQQILISHQAHAPNSASSEDVGRAEVYKADIVQARADNDIAPAWFAPALLAALRTSLAPVLRIAMTTYNLSCGDGRTRQFKVVPFIDGSSPIEHPHNLPALQNIDDITALTGPQATSYLNGYNLPIPHSIERRLNAIRIEIGCTA